MTTIVLNVTREGQMQALRGSKKQRGVKHMRIKRGRCVYCNSPQMYKGAAICRGCYEKLLLIRKIQSIVRMIKESAQSENHGGKHTQDD